MKKSNSKKCFVVLVFMLFLTIIGIFFVPLYFISIAKSNHSPTPILIDNFRNNLLSCSKFSKQIEYNEAITDETIFPTSRDFTEVPIPDSMKYDNYEIPSTIENKIQYENITASNDLGEIAPIDVVTSAPSIIFNNVIESSHNTRKPESKKNQIPTNKTTIKQIRVSQFNKNEILKANFNHSMTEFGEEATKIEDIQLLDLILAEYFEKIENN